MLRRVFVAGFSVAFEQLRSAAVRQGSQPFPPFCIIGNVYYVGGNDITSFLVTSPAGHVIVNSGYEETVPIIASGIHKLGFELKDVRYLLNGQAHVDHVAGQPILQQLTGARVVVSEGDERVVATGGQGDFRFEGKFSWRPCKVDRVIGDGDTVSIGGATLTAHITPGHTKGCTTWTLPVEKDGRRYSVVIVGGTTILPGDRLVNNPKYPRIADDYALTLRILRSLPCDVFLGAHGDYFGMQAKYERLKTGTEPNPFIDPHGYRAFVDRSDRTFQAELERERKINGV